MYGFIIVIHLIACIGMILIIIFQSSKGAEMGAVFGGGASQTAFGSSGPQSFLEKVTVVLAVIFMLTSLTLAYISSIKRSQLVEESQPVPIEQPVQQPVQPTQMPAMPEMPEAPPGE